MDELPILFTISLTPEMYRNLFDVAISKGLTVQDLIRNVLESYLDEEPRHQ